MLSEFYFQITIFYHVILLKNYLQNILLFIKKKLINLFSKSLHCLIIIIIIFKSRYNLHRTCLVLFANVFD
jgi:hypothetical protein